MKPTGHKMNPSYRHCKMTPAGFNFGLRVRLIVRIWSWFALALWTVDKSPWMNQRLTRESIVKDSTIILKFCPNSVFKFGISQLLWNFVRIRYFAIKDITVILKFRPNLVFFIFYDFGLAKLYLNLNPWNGWLLYQSLSPATNPAASRPRHH